MQRLIHLHPDLPPVCRLGLATRGNTRLEPEDVAHAVRRGVNYLNWCGKPDGLSRFLAGLGARRKDVVAATQFQARTADEARREFPALLDQLGSSYLDVATLYYVESDDEWRQLIAPGGVWDVLAHEKQRGRLKMIGLTSHQRALAASWACEISPLGGPYLDLLMIRYNAAHRGAERDVFPVTSAMGLPLVAFTGLRWRALLEPTPGDPSAFTPPTAAECYRFCLANPAVSVALTAPNGRAELDENLRLLDDWGAPPESSLKVLREHGDRVRQHAGTFW